MNNLNVTIFDGNRSPRTLVLNKDKKVCHYFGQNSTNDIVLSSSIVSHDKHGRFIYKNGQWFIEDRSFFGTSASTNGIIYNNSYISSWALHEGDFIRIDDGISTIEEGVLFVVSSSDSPNEWKTFDIVDKKITIGRDTGCNIVLTHTSVARQHAYIVEENGSYFLYDNSNTNGVVVNNQRIQKKHHLHEKDVIVIANSKIIFTSKVISYCSYNSGISIDVVNVEIERGKGRNKYVTEHSIDINIKPGELIAIVGGSGAGKSTIMNCMSGYIKPSRGKVYINGIDLYDNFDSLKEIIGYVPQADIVYDNLKLYDMLSYAAKMRLPKGLTNEEYKAAIDRAIKNVDLVGKENNMIGSQLSGGQKKRASIAVELLSDPSLMFLDEPASGLDPGTEKMMMTLLRKMAYTGKTIILVTHSVLQLEMCDRVLFLGKSGRVCFFGPYSEALDFFGIADITDVYHLLSDEAEKWWQAFNANKSYLKPCKQEQTRSLTVKRKKRAQLPVLCSRCIKLILNDKKRSIALFMIPPILAALISVVSNNQMYVQYETTNSVMFSMACAVFWIGMSNTIQEVCKERNILKREYMAGLSLNSYLGSKFIALGGICLIQSICVTIVFAILIGLPNTGVIMNAYMEILLITFLTALSASALGLFVSSLFKNPDRAQTVVPILLLPQLLFSGIIFELKGFSKVISWFTVCRWSMEGYGTTANLNNLELRCHQLGHMVGGYELPHPAESAFEYTSSHFLTVIAILLCISVASLVLSRIVLTSLKKEI